MTLNSDGYTCKFYHNFEEQNISVLQNQPGQEKRKGKRKERRKEGKERKEGGRREGWREEGGREGERRERGRKRMLDNRYQFIYYYNITLENLSINYLHKSATILKFKKNS